MRKTRNNIITFMEFAAVLIIIIGFICYPYVTRSQDTITINKTEVKRSNNSDKYLIFATDSNGEKVVLENTDSIAFLKFDSSDIQGELEVGTTYNIETSGIRIPFLSVYKNILEIEKVD